MTDQWPSPPDPTLPCAACDRLLPPNAIFVGFSPSHYGWCCCHNCAAQFVWDAQREGVPEIEAAWKYTLSVMPVADIKEQAACGKAVAAFIGDVSTERLVALAAAGGLKVLLGAFEDLNRYAEAYLGGAPHSARDLKDSLDEALQFREIEAEGRAAREG